MAKSIVLNSCKATHWLLPIMRRMPNSILWSHPPRRPSIHCVRLWIDCLVTPRRVDQMPQIKLFNITLSEKGYKIMCNDSDLANKRIKIDSGRMQFVNIKLVPLLQGYSANRSEPRYLGTGA